jgi:creatinine amidohydrolase/Fe(II)-dependent formamide hydrolase-like protein
MAKSGYGYVLAEMTVKEIRETLKKATTVLLPMGCTEQHGYHLPLSTDTLTAEYVAHKVAARTGCVVAPVIPYTFSGGELPGTVNISTQVLGLYVRDICRSFAEMGFKRIVLVLGHGGSENLRDIQESLKMFLRLEKAYKRLIIEVIGIWSMSPTWLKSLENHNYHADIIETSMILQIKPALVRKKYVLDNPLVHNELIADPDKYQVSDADTKAKTVLEGFCRIPHIQQRSDMKVGVMGNPKGANAKLGKKVLNEAINNLTKYLKTTRQKYE